MSKNTQFSNTPQHTEIKVYRVWGFHINPLAPMSGLHITQLDAQKA